jgi:hypothetical protein
MRCSRCKNDEQGKLINVGATECCDGWLGWSYRSPPTSCQDNYRGRREFRTRTKQTSRDLTVTRALPSHLGLVRMLSRCVLHTLIHSFTHSLTHGRHYIKRCPSHYRSHRCVFEALKEEKSLSTKFAGTSSPCTAPASRHKDCRLPPRSDCHERTDRVAIPQVGGNSGL